MITFYLLVCGFIITFLRNSNNLRLLAILGLPQTKQMPAEREIKHCYNIPKVIHFLMNYCVNPIRFHFPDYLYLACLLPQIFQQICVGGQKTEVCLA